MHPDALASKKMHDFLDVELVLFFAADVLGLGVKRRSLIETEFGHLLLEFVVSLLAGVEAEDCEEEVKEIDDGIGIVEDGVGGLRSLGDEVGLATDLALEVLEVEEGRGSGQDELSDEEVEELLLYFGVE